MAIRTYVACSGVITLLVGTIISISSPAVAKEHSGSAENYAGSQIAIHEDSRDNPTPTVDTAADQILGHDVSSWQENVDWRAAKDAGAEFVYIKATEGTGYTSEYFTQQYNGSYNVGMIRGAYHFARPEISDGATQAEYFLDHGGGWSADGKTLPGALDLEYNPYGDDCYGLSPEDMTAWIDSFTSTYNAHTGRFPVIYTSTTWWKKCTGNSADFGSTSPLWIANYSSEPGSLPAGWEQHTIWQFSDEGDLPGDQNYFNGEKEQLVELATG